MNGGPAAIFTHLTIVGNTATGNAVGPNGGGGIYLSGKDSMLTSCLVAGNTSPFGPDIDNTFGPAPSSGGGNLIGDNTRLTWAPLANDQVGTGASPISPRVAPLAANGGITQTISLLPGSPALDKGVASAIATDQRGFVRTRDGDNLDGALPDVGAYEAQAAPFSAGFNFVGGGPAGSAGTLTASDLAGAPGFDQTNWNNLSMPSDGTGTGSAPNAATRRDSAGRSYPELLLWWNSPGTWGHPSAGLDTADKKLMGGYLDSNGVDDTANHDDSDDAMDANLSGTPDEQPFLAIAGLPEAAIRGGYRVIVYADSDTNSGRIAQYWIASNRGVKPSDVRVENKLTPFLFSRDAANFPASPAYVRGTATLDTGASTAAGNYFVFEGLIEPGLTVRADEGSLPAPPSTLARAPLNAVQIVRNEIVVVTTAADELDPIGVPGTGISLREAIRDAAPGSGILFDPALAGQTVTLTLGQFLLNKNLTIDASDVPNGITISGNSNGDDTLDPGESRIFEIAAGVATQLRFLTLINGKAADSGNFVSYGGAAFNRGNLTLSQCTVANSRAVYSGAIDNYGTITLNHSAIAGNSAMRGGGATFNNYGATVILNHSTLTGNSALGPAGAGSADGGGAIYNQTDSRGAGTLILNHSTIAGNSAEGGGGGIRNDPNALLALHNSIVAGNRRYSDDPNSGDDIDGFFEALPGTSSIVLAQIGGFNTGTGDVFSDDPLFAPLGNYGGPTQTLALLPGSPARNTATGSLGTADQRGFPIVGLPDIGAYESGNLLDYDAWAYETLPIGTSAAGRAGTFDNEDDSRDNTLEYATLGDAFASDTGATLTFAPNAAGTESTIVFPVRFNATDLLYRIERSFDLSMPWTTIAEFETADAVFRNFVPGLNVTFGPASATITDPGIAGKPRAFYRMRASVTR